MKSSHNEVEAILGRAFERAVAILDDEVRELLRTQPKRYARFVMAVGWGNQLFGPAGEKIRRGDLTARAREVIKLADRIHDTLGADNHEVRLSARVRKVTWSPECALIISGGPVVVLRMPTRWVRWPLLVRRAGDICLAHGFRKKDISRIEGIEAWKVPGRIDRAFAGDSTILPKAWLYAWSDRHGEFRLARRPATEAS